MRVAARESFPGAVARVNVERILLAVFAVAGAVGVLKGLAPDVVPGSEFYWLLNYDHGFIRRALIGTLIRPAFAVFSFQQLKPIILDTHVVVCFGTIGIWYALFRRAVIREEAFDARLTLTLAFLCLMASPLMPTLGLLVGYVDVYILLLMLIAFWLALEEHHLPAALVAAIGPLIHESFIFLWAPVALVLAWSCATARTNVRSKLLVAVLPVISTAAVVFLQSDAAVRQAIDALPVSDTLKDGLRAFELEQTVRSSFDMMRRYQFPGNSRNIETSIVFFLLPSVAIVAASGFCFWRRWNRPWTTLIVVCAATLSPTIALAFAWDLSRFLVWSNAAAAIALIASGTLLVRR